MSLDLHWVTPQLALGGRVPPDAVPALAAEHGIGAVVDLRDEESDDAAAMAAAGVAFLHLPTPDMHPPRAADLDRGTAFAAARLAEGERVLIHCQHGIGRSAVLALCVLVDAGEAPMAALARAKAAREIVSPSPRQFEGWCGWLAARGIAAPDMDTFGRLAYRHLAKADA
ncbi:MAG: dual specificity protein phosphatase family protein [Caulobacteraceae bacterium]|nr:dual specificity protein phosphatase family protein [Caulobacter sp.]